LRCLGDSPDQTTPATGIEFVAGEAGRPIHDNDTDRLRQLLAAHPALVSWRDEEGRTLLGAATESFGDSGDPYREQMFTARPVRRSSSMPEPRWTGWCWKT